MLLFFPFFFTFFFTNAQPRRTIIVFELFNVSLMNERVFVFFCSVGRPVLKLFFLHFFKEKRRKKNETNKEESRTSIAFSTGDPLPSDYLPVLIYDNEMVPEGSLSLSLSLSLSRREATDAQWMNSAAGGVRKRLFLRFVIRHFGCWNKNKRKNLRIAY